MESITKERILDAALVSFAEHGYKGTNLRDLAAGMGLSKSALYRHYESKEDAPPADLYAGMIFVYEASPSTSIKKSPQ